MGTPCLEYGPREIDYLGSRDRALGEAMRRLGPIRRELNPDPFSALAESVVGQMISPKAARTVRGRLAALCGPDYGGLRLLTADEIKACGMSMRKAECLAGIARAAADGSVDFGALADKDDEEVVGTLTSLRGVGRWTAEMLLIFSLARPDVVSYGDLGIRGGMTRLYSLDGLSRRTFDRYVEGYSPYGTVASLYLWAVYAEGRPGADQTISIASP